MSIITLENYNKIRQELCNETFEQADEIWKATGMKDNAIVLFNKDWHIGIVGIVASKFVDKYYKPTFIMTYNEETKQYLENPDVTEEQMIAFNNDERVKELSQIQSGAAVIELYGSASLASIIFYVIIPLTNNRGSTLGKKFMTLAVVDDKKEYVSKKKRAIRGISYFLINIIGGMISNGLFIMGSLVVSIVNKDGKSIHDLIAKTNVISLNNKYDIVSEEEDEYYKRIAKENARDLTVKGDNYYDK
jgi:hypothetical protein